MKNKRLITKWFESYEFYIMCWFFILLISYILAAYLLIPHENFGSWEQATFADPWIARTETILNGGILYRDVFTTTPPLTNFLIMPPALFAIWLGLINPWSTLAFMVYFSLFNLLTAIVLLHTFKNRNVGYRIALFFLLNPLTFGNAILRRQDESILVFFFSLVIYFINKDRHWQTMITIGLTMLVKLTGGILLVVAFLHYRSWKYLIYPTLFFFAVLSPFLLVAGQEAMFWDVTKQDTEHPFQISGISIIALWGQLFKPNPPPFYPSLQFISALFVIGVGITILLIAKKRAGILESITILTIAVLLLTPKLHIGYFCILVLTMSPILQKYDLVQIYFAFGSLLIFGDLFFIMRDDYISALGLFLIVYFLLAIAFIYLLDIFFLSKTHIFTRWCSQTGDFLKRISETKIMFSVKVISLIIFVLSLSIRLPYYTYHVNHQELNFVNQTMLWLPFVAEFNVTPYFIQVGRMPFILIISVLLVTYHLLLRKLIPSSIAFPSLLIFIITPVCVIYSYTLNFTMLKAIFINSAILMLLGYSLHQWSIYWFIFATLLTGVVCLNTKSVWGIMFCSLIINYLSYRQQTMTLRNFIASSLIWLITGLLVIGFNIKNIYTIDMGSDLYYFMGKLTTDPGLFFYPVVWILRTTPLEFLGFLLGVIILWRGGLFSSISDVLSNRVKHQLTFIALLSFLTALMLGLTFDSSKHETKLLFLLPISTIFCTYGLLWMLDKFNLSPHVFSLIVILLPLTQLGLILPPQIYYNPLAGGTEMAKRVIPIEKDTDLVEAATYLNKQPNDAYQVTLPLIGEVPQLYFEGEVIIDKTWPGLQADYIVYPYAVLQQLHSNFSQIDDSHPYLRTQQKIYQYLQKHYPVVKELFVNGRKLGLIYKSPKIEYLVNQRGNSLIGIVDIVGYNVTANQSIKLFWHNRNNEPKELFLGFIATQTGEINWMPCIPLPEFMNEIEPTIIESDCLLMTDLASGFYNLQAGLRQDSAINSIGTVGLGTMFISETGTFEPRSTDELLQKFVSNQLPKRAIPLQINFTDRMRLSGIDVEQPSTFPNLGKITLYWQPVQQPDFGLAKAYQLTFKLTKLSVAANKLTLFSAKHPLISNSFDSKPFVRGQVIPMTYPIEIATQIPPNEYDLEICLVVNQDLNNQPVQCFNIPITL